MIAAAIFMIFGRPTVCMDFNLKLLKVCISKQTTSLYELLFLSHCKDESL